jgi:hypothetical protein
VKPSIDVTTLTSQETSQAFNDAAPFLQRHTYPQQLRRLHINIDLDFPNHLRLVVVHSEYYHELYTFSESTLRDVSAPPRPQAATMPASAPTNSLQTAEPAAAAPMSTFFSSPSSIFRVFSGLFSHVHPMPLSRAASLTSLTGMQVLPPSNEASEGSKAGSTDENELHLRGGELCPGRFCFIIPCPIPINCCII